MEILRTVFRPEQIVVADGVDQYVRDSVADCASALGLDNWDLESNPDANGGRVIIVEGKMAHDTAIFERLKKEAAELGNYHVDLLACVPPTNVVISGA